MEMEIHNKLIDNPHSHMFLIKTKMIMNTSTIYNLLSWEKIAITYDVIHTFFGQKHDRQMTWKADGDLLYKGNERVEGRENREEEREALNI